METPDFGQLRQAYSQYSNEELLRLATERESLTAPALEALRLEIEKRGLEWQNRAPEPRLQTERSDLVGVRGWLLLFCIWTTVGPLFTGLSIARLMLLGIDLSQYFGGQEKIVFAALTTLGLSTLSVVAGLTVWRVSPTALMWVKIFLITDFAIGAVSLFIYTGSSLPKISTILFPVVWIWYFSRSERVRMTLGRNLWEAS